MNTTPKDNTPYDLSHLKSPRDILRWAYNHGHLIGEFPDSGNDKKVILDVAEAKLRDYIAREIAEVIGTGSYSLLQDQRERAESRGWRIER